MDGDPIRGRVQDIDWDVGERKRVDELRNGIFLTALFWAGVGLGFLLGRLLP